MQLWVLIAVLTVMAMMFVVLPLRHYQRNPPVSDELDQDEVNLVLLRGQLAELDERQASGAVSEQEYCQLRTEIERRLLNDVGAEAAVKERRNRVLPLALTALIPVAAVAMYLNFGASDQIRQRAAIQELFQIQSAKEMGVALEEIVRQWPEDYQSRFMLAGTYMGAGRFDLAAREYEAVVNQTGRQQAEPIIQLAQALYLGAGNVVNEKVNQLIELALALEPNNSTALGLAGISAFEATDYRKAISVWEQLLSRTVDPMERDALNTGITKARQALGETVAAPESSPASASGAQVKVQVSLGADFAELPDSARVFVYATTASRSMPLAIAPLRAADLPREVVLDDRSAMIEGRSLSAYEQVDIVARISMNGDVMTSDHEVRLTGVNVNGDRSNALVITRKQP